MIIYEQQKRFNAVTGEPRLTWLRTNRIICDYCGQEPEHLKEPLHAYDITDMPSDPWYAEDEVEGLTREQVWQLYEAQPKFHYCCGEDWDDGDCDYRLMIEAFSTAFSLKKKDSEIIDKVVRDMFGGRRLPPSQSYAPRLAAIMSQARYRVLYMNEKPWNKFGILEDSDL